MSKSSIVALTLVLVGGLGAQEPQKAVPPSLTIEEVVQMSSAGVSEDVIITRVKRNAKPFDLNQAEIIELSRSGVSGTVIKYLLDPTVPYIPPAPPALPPPSPTPTPGSIPAPPPSKPPSDPLAQKVPPEVGIYFLDADGEFVALDLKQVVPAKQPGKMPSLLSAGLLKGHIIGSVVGSSARARITTGNSVFYSRLGDGKAIDDLALLVLDHPKGKRNLDFGTKPGKPVFPVNSVKSFESKEVSAGLFRLTVSLNSRGELLFFILGSGDDKKGLLGKGYDFGVD